MNTSSKLTIHHSLLTILCLWLLPLTSLAQQQQQGLCAQITIVISQQLTIERVGFLATLQITDNDPNNPITDFSANLTFQNPALSSNGVVNDSSSLFFVQPPTLQNIASVNGGGVIGVGPPPRSVGSSSPPSRRAGPTPRARVISSAPI